MSDHLLKATTQSSHFGRSRTGEVRLNLFICLFMCRFQEKLQQRAKEGKPVFEDYRWIRNPSDTSTLETEEEKRCLKDVVSLLSFFV